jgi:HEAT repeat protein
MTRTLMNGLALVVACGPALAALAPAAAWASAPESAAATRAGSGVAAVLESFPAETKAKRDALCAEILRLGPAAIEEAGARVRPAGQGDDSKARFALNGLAVYVTRPGAERERVVFARALFASLEKASDPEVAAFLISQLQVAGKRESVRPLQKYLASEALAGPAAAALVAIGGPDAAKALVRSLGAAPAAVRPALVGALGELRRREALPALLPLADDADEATRRAALVALARLGDTAAGPLLARSRLAASPRERAEAPALYMLYARSLVESGRTAEGLAAARGILATHQQPGEVQHAAQALALIVEARAAQALPDLLAAVGSSDASFRGAALALAGQVPGPEATARWVEKARTSPPDACADIVSMLGRRGDATALPFVRESLDSRDAAVRRSAIPAAARLGGDAVLPDLLRALAVADVGGLAAPDTSELAALKAALLGYRAELVVPEAAPLVDPTPLPGKAVLVEVLAAKGARGRIDVPGLLATLEEATGRDAAQLGDAIAAAVRANPGAEAATDALLEQLKTASPARKAAILGVLPGVGGTRALQALVAFAASTDSGERRAAIAALSRWPDSLAAEDLRRIGAATTDRGERVLAFEGFVRVMDAARLPSRRKLAAFQELLAVPGEDADRKPLLAGVSGVREPESLRLLAGYLDNPVLRDEAAAALLQLASRQAPQERWLSGHEAYSVLRRALDSLADPAAKARAQAIRLERLRQGGFVPLFDGRSLDGWKGLVADPPGRTKMTAEELSRAQAEADRRMRAHWRVEDGALVFDGRGDSLCTESDYSDFELLVDWKIGPGGDSGIYLRGSPQVQIWDAAPNPAGSGGLYNNKKGPSQPLEKADRPVGEWNSFRIVMLGERVTVYLNDRRVVDSTVLENYWERDKPIYPAGQIELQAHGNPLWFRNVFVREIPRDPSVPTLTSAEAAEGFVPLFNGRDLEGWTGKASGYAAEDGKIVVHPERGGGNLYTAKEYTDFVLRFDFKLTPAANNGLGIRAPLEGDAAYVGMELQILEDGSPVHWKLAPYQYHGSVYGVVPARRGVLKPVGEWNSEEVTVRGRRVSVVVNGVTVVDTDLDAASAGGTIDRRDHPGLGRTSGHIGLLGHGSVVEFRNIRIRETP